MSELRRWLILLALRMRYTARRQEITGQHSDLCGCDECVIERAW